MTVGSLCQDLGVIVDKVEELHGAEHGLAQFLVTHLHGLTEGRILQEALPEGGGGVCVATLEAPRLDVVGVAEIAVAIGEIVVPYGPCMQLAARAVVVLFLLVEIGAALVAVGIQTEFGMGYARKYYFNSDYTFKLTQMDAEGNENVVEEGTYTLPVYKEQDNKTFNYKEFYGIIQDSMGRTREFYSAKYANDDRIYLILDNESYYKVN